MATQEAIAVKLSELATLYRQAMSADELHLLGLTWSDLLGDLSDEDFEAAARHHCRGSRFFPTPADILAAQEARPRPRPAFALPERTRTDEDAQWDGVCAAMLLASVGGNPRARDFFAAGRGRAERDALAREVLGRRYPTRGDAARDAGRRVWRPEPRKLPEAAQ